MSGRSVDLYKVNLNYNLTCYMGGSTKSQKACRLKRLEAKIVKKAGKLPRLCGDIIHVSAYKIKVSNKAL